MKTIEAMANGSYNFVPITDNRTVFPNYATRARAGKIAHLVCVSQTIFSYL